MTFGHASTVEILSRLQGVERGSFGFFGPEHVGKHRMGESFARELLAHPEPLPLTAHPDFALYDAQAVKQDAQIVEKAEHCRAWLERVHQTSARGGRRVFLLDHVEAFTMHAFNALLKTLEEPNAGVVFLVIVSREALLPATVRSRLVPLHFGALSLGELQALCRAQNMDEAWAKEAYGRPGLLVRRKEDPSWWDGIMRSAVEMVSAVDARAMGALVGCIDAFQKRAEGGSSSPAQDWRLLLFLVQQRFLLREPFNHEDAHGISLAWRWLEGTIPSRTGLEWNMLRVLRPHDAPFHLLRDLEV